MFSETKEINKEEKDEEYNINMQNGKRQIKKEMQKLYYYLYCLSSNDIYDAAMRHHFIKNINLTMIYTSNVNVH